eukprot:gene1476-12094_t
MSAIDNAQSTDPLKLKHYLNLMNALADEGRTQEAIDIGKKTFDNAIADLDSVSESDYKDATLYMQLIRDKLKMLIE